LGPVDLPIARERHTGWPFIPGSSLKGVLRAACRSKLALAGGGGKPNGEAKADGEGNPIKRADGHPDLVRVFGPSLQGGGDQASRGALGVTDARLLALPLRSARGVFAWVTCPAVLQRFADDFGLCGVGMPDWWAKNEAVDPQAALVVPESPLVLGGHGEYIILEDMQFRATPSPTLARFAGWLAGQALREGPSFAGATTRLSRGLVVVPDDDFTYFSCFATEIETRIALNYETKTVAGSALFTQEYLPSQTLLYALLLNLEGAGAAGRTHWPVEYVTKTASVVPGLLQIGSDETTGKGFCQARVGGELPT
jgi:CRISPR-associated protein Cmr4